MANTWVGSLSDYEEAYKAVDVDPEGVSSWTRYFLQPLQKQYNEAITQTTQQYSAGISPIKQQSAYDISQAYANYKQQELALLQQERLGAGFKEQQALGLRQAYTSAYSDIKREEASALTTLASEQATALSKITSNYEKQLEAGQKEETKRISQIAETSQKLDQALIDFGKTYGKNLAEFQDINWDDLGKSGVLQTTQGKTEGTTETTFTQYGKLLADALLHAQVSVDGNTTSFIDYLRATNSKLYDQYMTNPQLYNRLIAGLSDKDFEFTSEERTEAGNIQHQQRVKKYEEAIASDKTFDENYNTALNNTKEAENKGINSHDLVRDLAKKLEIPANKFVFDNFGYTGIYIKKNELNSAQIEMLKKYKFIDNPNNSDELFLDTPDSKLARLWKQLENAFAI